MKIAILQTSYSENVNEKLRNMVGEASKNGAELVLLKELHQSPYFPITENPENFDFANNFESDLEFWSDVAKRNSVVLVTSLFEKRAEGLYHNTAFVFEKDGTLAGKYRKMHIPDDPAFYEKFYFTEGDLGFNPIQTSVGKLGVLICWDQWYPEPARLMAMAGAEILIYPTAIGWLDEEPKEERESQKRRWRKIQESHAIANGIPVVAINRVGFESDPSKNFNGITFWGGSFLVDARGEEIVSGSESEEIIYGEVDKKESDEVRRMWPFFRDRRISEYGDLNRRWRD
ncbi:putative amidohydrolase [Thiovulum sp. ES]|nr:putative amidohydrolase [Thiovulum sp. ES]